MMGTFLYVFIPIFVAMDPGGIIPVYLALTEGLTASKRKRVAWQALSTAFAISLVFIIAGRLIFEVLGITVADFQIAGGLLLLVLAIVELIREGTREAIAPQSPGPVPLGIPLIVGPAVLTSLLMLIPLYGYRMTVTALLLNLLIVAGAFRLATPIVSWVGKNGLRATSKVISLFLAAIAVSMIRRGIETLR
jgi:multiple antibiotic resistance protein